MFSSLCVIIISLSLFAQGSLVSHGAAKRRHSEIALHKRETSATNAPGTHYDTTTAQSACGDFPPPSSFVVAMNSPSFQGSCHKPITIKYKGKQTTAKIVDECPTCWPHGIDMSNGLFEFFAPLETGLIYVDWFIGGEEDAPPKPAPPPPPPVTHHTTTTTSHHTTSSSHSSPKPSPSSSKPAPKPSASPAVVSVPSGNIQAVFQAMVKMGDAIVAGANANGTVAKN